MREIVLPGGKAIIARGILSKAGEELKKQCAGRTLAVVSDETVWSLYGAALAENLTAAGFSVFSCLLPAGESSKTLSRVQWLYDQLLAHGFTRSDGVVALGGGVVGDLAGFAAATMYRGVPLFQLPTTLLAQLDSSIGGKTGVDLPQGKNLVGAFYQPRLTLIDPDVLTTLSPRQHSAGAAEAVKYGLIADETILTALESSAPDWEEIIARCCAIKAALVRSDEHDNGARRILNFGHTLGHVYEALGDYHTWYHGEAVATGMVDMLRLEEQQGQDVRALRERVERLLTALSLPCHIESDPHQILRYLAVDKKRSDGDITVVEVAQAGSATLRTLPLEQFISLLEETDGD
jgi:3-dehydroquinate synthase